MLEALGHEVVTASSAEQAMDLLDEDVFDVALVDWRLPGGADGLFLTSRIRVEHTEVPVVVCTGEPRDLEAEAKSAGARAFLRKPIGARELSGELMRITAEAGVTEIAARRGRAHST